MPEISTELHEKERIIRVKKKNGSIYVYKRLMRYNPKKGFEECVKSQLLGKIMPGSDEMVPTRPKRDSKKKADSDSSSAGVTASRKRTGMTDMLEFIGKHSGLDQAVRNALADSDARKLLSIARFWASTHDTLPHFEKWQIMHQTPYPDGISEDVYYKFCQQIGVDETARQRLFHELCRLVGTSPILAFDSTTISTYSRNQTSARYGFNKDNDGLPTLKLVSLFGQENMIPVGFAFQPGDIADCASLQNTLKELDSLGLTSPEIVFDAGFGTKPNITSLLRSHQKFLGLGDLSSKWIHGLLDLTDATEKKNEMFEGIPFGSVSARDRLQRIEATCPFDEHTLASTVSGMMLFSWERQRSRNGREAHTIESKRFRMYVHFFMNTQRRETQVSSLRKRLFNLRELILGGTTQFTEQAQKLIDELLVVKTVKGHKLSVTFNEKAFEKRTRDYGMFALVSNCERDPFEALKHYRMREHIESDFRIEKSNLDAGKPRVWTLESLTGREICRQIALGYEFALQERIRKVQQRVKLMINEEGRTKKDIEKLTKLLTWLNDRSVLGILEWFDCIETTEVQTPVACRRWSTEKTKQDQLFLSLFFDPNL